MVIVTAIQLFLDRTEARGGHCDSKRINSDPTAEAGCTHSLPILTSEVCR